MPQHLNTRQPVIDLRSDTVSRPTAAMRHVMSTAEVGDDVLGDDPTVLLLQERIAHIMGKAAACFVPSGTMANQTAIRAQTEPGDEIIAHRDSHIIHYETGAPAALSGVMVQPLDGSFGLFDAADVDNAVRPRSSHYATSALLIVENTHNRGGGAVWPLEQIQRVTQAAKHHDLRTHLDGARLWNACAATGLSPSTYASHFDTVSCCFSKGLGAPAGSAVCGSIETITRVHRFRKMFGGAMRQAGILAAACLHALDHHRDRLVDDHARARHLGEALAVMPGLTLAMPIATNMVFIDLDPSLGTAQAVSERLHQLGVAAMVNRPHRLRMVVHLDIEDVAITRAIEAFGTLTADPDRSHSHHPPAPALTASRTAASASR